MFSNDWFFCIKSNDRALIQKKKISKDISSSFFWRKIHRLICIFPLSSFSQNTLIHRFHNQNRCPLSKSVNFLRDEYFQLFLIQNLLPALDFLKSNFFLFVKSFSFLQNTYTRNRGSSIEKPITFLKNNSCFFRRNPRTILFWKNHRFLWMKNLGQRQLRFLTYLKWIHCVQQTVFRKSTTKFVRIHFIQKFGFFLLFWRIQIPQMLFFNICFMIHNNYEKEETFFGTNLLIYLQ